MKGVRVGLNLCSKTVSWADVLFAYSCTATLNYFKMSYKSVFRDYNIFVKFTWMDLIMKNTNFAYKVSITLWILGVLYSIPDGV